MRRTVFEVGAAAAAGLITYMASTGIGTLNSAVRWGLVILITVVAFALAWFAVRHTSGKGASGAKDEGGIRIGNRISAKDDVLIDQIEVSPGSEHVTLGEDMKSKGKATLSRITVGRKRPKK